MGGRRNVASGRSPGRRGRRSGRALPAVACGPAGGPGLAVAPAPFGGLPLAGARSGPGTVAAPQVPVDQHPGRLDLVGPLLQVLTEGGRDAGLGQEGLDDVLEPVLVDRELRSRPRVGVGDQLEQALVAGGHPEVGELQLEHLLPAAPSGDPQPGQHPPGRPAVARAPGARQVEVGSGVERSLGPQQAPPPVQGVVALTPPGLAEQGVTDRLDPAPVGGQAGLVLLDPQRRRGRHLRGGGRRPLAVPPGQLGAAEAGPRDVGGVGGHARRLHGRLRPEGAVHLVELVVGRAVGHGPGHGDDPLVAGRVDEGVGRAVGKPVAAGRHQAQALLVGLVDRVGPGPGGQPAHAEGGHGAADVGGVEQGGGQGAGPQQHHPVGDAQGNDLGVGRAADHPEVAALPVDDAAGHPPGQDAERSGAVARVVHDPEPGVGVDGVGRRPVGRDEAPLQALVDVDRGGLVVGPVAGVDVGHPGSGVGEVDGGPGRPELGVVTAEVPGEAITDHLAAGAVLVDVGRAVDVEAEEPGVVRRLTVGGEPGVGVGVGVDRRAVDDVGLDEQHVTDVDAELVGHPGVGLVPGAWVGAPAGPVGLGLGLDHEPLGTTVEGQRRPGTGHRDPEGFDDATAGRAEQAVGGSDAGQHHPGASFVVLAVRAIRCHGSALQFVAKGLKSRTDGRPPPGLDRLGPSDGRAPSATASARPGAARSSRRRAGPSGRCGPPAGWSSGPAGR